MRRPGNKRDARVPKCGQMLYRLTNSVLIVDPDIGDPLDIGSYVDEYQRNTSETKVFEQGFFHAEGEDCHPVHAAFDHAPYGQFHPFGIIHGRGEQDFVVILDRKIFKRLHDFREKGIGEFRNDQAKNAAPSGNQMLAPECWGSIQVRPPPSKLAWRAEGRRLGHD